MRERANFCFNWPWVIASTQGPKNEFCFFLCWRTRWDVFARDFIEVFEYFNILNDYIAEASNKPIFKMATGDIQNLPIAIRPS